MKIYYKDLNNKLSQGIAPIYILSSDEPFWHEEVQKEIINASLNFGFTLDNKVSFSGDSLDIDEFGGSCLSPGLFADKIIVTLTLSDLKQGTAALTMLKETLNPTLLAIVCLPQLSNSDLKSKILAPLVEAGIAIVFYPLDERQQIDFVMDRARRLNLQLDQEAAFILKESYLGNLAALNQAIQKLELAGFANKGLITADIIKEQTSYENHFSIFELTEAFIDYNYPIIKRINVLKTLYNEGVNIAVLIMRVGAALKTLYEMRTIIDRGALLDDFFGNHPLLRNLRSKQNIYRMAANSITTPQIQDLIKILCEADIKARNFDEKYALMLLEEIAVKRTNANFNLTDI